MYLTYAQLQEQFPQTVSEFENRIAAEKRQEIGEKSRIGYFTASEFYKLFTKAAKPAKNETSRAYIERKALERITGVSIKEDLSGIKAIQRGIELEPEMIAAYQARTQIHVSFTEDFQKSFKIEEYNVSAKPDGVTDVKVLEGKCPELHNHIDNIEYGNNIEWFMTHRFDYWVQAQVQMWCVGREHCDFMSYCNHQTLNPDYWLHIIPIQRDNDFIERCKEAALFALESLKNEIKRREKYFKK